MRRAFRDPRRKTGRSGLRERAVARPRPDYLKRRMRTSIELGLASDQGQPASAGKVSRTSRSSFAAESTKPRISASSKRRGTHVATLHAQRQLRSGVSIPGTGII